MKQNKNLACRIFKEQIDLIQQLPENERAEVLYKAILSAFNQIENQNDIQIENQNDIQIENQNEYAYVSVSDSVSVLSKTVYSLLEKNIVCKEFSNNYGGKRTGAGRPIKEPEKAQVVEKEERKNFVPPKDADEVYEFAQVNCMMCTKEQAQDFFDYYSGIGWRIGNEFRTPMNDWRPFWRKWLRNPLATKNQFGQRTVRMSAKEIKEAENHIKLQKMLNGEL